MEQYVIKGGNPLVGEVEIGGAKNAALGILAAARIARAAFFAPPISTSPTNGFPPLITYCSISHLYALYSRMP